MKSLQQYSHAKCPASLSALTMYHVYACTFIFHSPTVWGHDHGAHWPNCMTTHHCLWVFCVCKVTLQLRWWHPITAVSCVYTGHMRSPGHSLWGTAAGLGKVRVLVQDSVATAGSCCCCCCCWGVGGGSTQSQLCHHRAKVHTHTAARWDQHSNSNNTHRQLCGKIFLANTSASITTKWNFDIATHYDSLLAVISLIISAMSKGQPKHIFNII